LAAEYFPGALSVDLISGLPYQSEKILLNDIDTALSFKPAHVSLYALTLEPETPLAKKKEVKALIPCKDEADRLWLCGRDALEKNGLSLYEVSNFCVDGKESRHNIRYWRMENWLALGPAASGTIIDDENGCGIRYTIPPGTPFEELDSLTLIKETLLMGFRYIDGPDEELFLRRFHRSLADCIPKTIDIWRNRGLLNKELLSKKKYALTKEGLLFLDSFLAEAFLELDQKN
jgi:oxygen-independent coproporphyrinogen-3 oxidase